MVLSHLDFAMVLLAEINGNVQLVIELVLHLLITDVAGIPITLVPLALHHLGLDECFHLPLSMDDPLPLDMSGQIMNLR
jgi:hypothetical protein